MKYTKYILATLCATLLFATQAGAEYRIYNNVEDFEKDKGAICEAATDGCNNFFLKDGKVMGGTKKLCMNHTPEWNCTKYKENSITTLSMPVTTTSIDVETTSTTVSDNDRNFLEHLRKNVQESHQEKVDSLLFKIESKTGRMHPTLANKYYDKWVQAIDKKINSILLSYPQDIALPSNVNNQYLVLKLLKLEIEINLKK